MLGAIAGDVIGSVHEGADAPPKDFPLFVPASRFTDDTVMSVAVASALLHGLDYTDELRRWGRAYPDAGYGGLFLRWLFDPAPRPYQSFGNGSAMRVAAVSWALDDLDDILAEAARSAAVTHDHPEGIKGAQAVACAVFLARTGASKPEIRTAMEQRFGYDCSASLDALRKLASFDVTCQGTVPPAVVAFLESADFEDAVRNAISLGGDADTLACIAGAIAEAWYGGVPEHVRSEVMARLDAPIATEVRAFTAKFVNRHP